MRSILVNAGRDPGNDARIETALGLARHYGGHVTVLYDTPVARYIATDPVGGSYVLSEVLEKARADDDAAADEMDARLARGDVAFDILRCDAEPVQALASAARLADLVIVSRANGFAGDLALNTRAPVLALADGPALAVPVERACVAWDGGEQAAAALRAAVPLLKSCASVTVLTVAEKAEGLPASTALHYLSRHGVHAEFDELERGNSTEETLAAAAARAGAQLLVMGAYGKNRMREFLFGGVTAYFLSEETAPALLLAH